MMKYLFYFVLLAGLTACTSAEKDTVDTTIVQNETEQVTEVESDTEDFDFTTDQQLQDFFDHKKSDEQVLVEATVIKILPDDNDGSRHQKFIVELASGQTILIAHNIDLAPRVAGLSEGDEVVIFGEYEWSAKGGVIHWTHHDPSYVHEDGWIYFEGNYFG